MSEIFNDLIVSEENILRDAVQKAKTLIGIEQTSGNLVLRIPPAQISNSDLIALHLIGRYFANQMKKADSASLASKDLTVHTGLDYSTVTARLAELVNAGWIRRVSRGEFQVNISVLNSFLDEINSSQSKRTILPTEPSTLQTALDDQARTTRRSRHGNLTASILDALGKEWGRTPRDWKEIMQELKRNGNTFSEGSLTGTLTLLTQSRRVRRIKDGRSYRYTLA